MSGTTVQIAEYLKKFDLSHDDYLTFFGGGISGQFIPPRKMMLANKNLNPEDAFYLLCHSVFHACNNLINQKASMTEQATFAEGRNVVGEIRARNFKLAIYTEINYRCVSNDLPEFATLTTVTSQHLNVNGNPRIYTAPQMLLTSAAIAFLTNSDWEDLDINPDHLKFKFNEIYINKADAEAYIDSRITPKTKGEKGDKGEKGEKGDPGGRIKMFEGDVIETKEVVVPPVPGVASEDVIEYGLCVGLDRDNGLNGPEACFIYKNQKGNENSRLFLKPFVKSVTGNFLGSFEIKGKTGSADRFIIKLTLLNIFKPTEEHMEFSVLQTQGRVYYYDRSNN